MIHTHNLFIYNRQKCKRPLPSNKETANSSTRWTIRVIKIKCSNNKRFLEKFWMQNIHLEDRYVKITVHEHISNQGDLEMTETYMHNIKTMLGAWVA